jgi:hypothetical protein
MSMIPTKLRAARSPLKVFDETTFSILAAVADRISPAGNGFPSAWEVQVPEKIDSLFSKVHPGDTKDYANGLMLIENSIAGLLFDGRFGNFTSSSPEVQDQTIESFRTSKLQLRRTIFKALYGTCTAAYWSSPVLNASMGYPGPPDYGNGRGQTPSRPTLSPEPGSNQEEMNRRDP